MKITSTRQIYIQPVLFKTISFHHQSEYFLEFQLKYRQPHIQDSISAYPYIVQSQSQTAFNKKKLFKPEKQNKVQTQKFLILFNDQSIILKDGCKFIIETDRNVDNIKETKRKIQSQLIIRLFRKHGQKVNNQHIKKNLNGKIQKVGQQVLCINFNLENDFSQFSSFRHIVFPTDQYFCSLLFYIDFVHLGINIREKGTLRLDQFSILNNKAQDKKVKSLKRSIKDKCDISVVRKLLQFKQLNKLHKLLIDDRIKQLKRVAQLYKNFLSLKIKYMKNYKTQQSEQIQSHTFLNRLYEKNILINLDHLNNFVQKNDNYFYQYYETDNLDEVYCSMFNDSKIICNNIRKVWSQLIQINLRTLPEEFQHYALKYKIDRLRYVSQYYSVVDQFIYSDRKQILHRIQNHHVERVKVCQNSKFYNANELKHSMLTFHSEKTQNIISNSSEKQQSQILVVLVHGFKGSQRDMAKIKSFINTFTSINFLPLQTLDKLENSDINSMGKKGADQISNFLKKKPYISSINMIGFSLGGIIIKSIVSHLSAHKQKFNLLLTLSSPHLGITQLENCLINTGIFFIKKFGRAKNIRQLCCQPLNGKSNDITLLELSQNSCLEWFKHVVLIGSNEDEVIPKYSSLMAYRGSNQLIKKIQQNTLKSIKSLDRITVWFDYEQTCSQKLTGRKGHINFIEDETFLQYVIIKYLQFF